ncbi:MAG TPA: hypothetical protein VFG68_09715 [Fimbriiglobus sp.]|nr:hypothetical protein [Fimbriiglobus sp.]
MPVAEFLNNFRSASLFLAPWESANGAPPSPEQLADVRKYSALWLTPDAVKGFDTSVFYSLTPEQKRDLDADIAGFRTIAEQVPADQPATEEQVIAARKQFLAIYRVVGRYLFDDESLRVVKAAKDVMAADWFPKFVVGFDYRLGDDWSGDPAVWVWMIGTDEAAERDQLYEWLDPLRQAIIERLDAEGIGRLVYLNFRTVSEQREQLEGVEE